MPNTKVALTNGTDTAFRSPPNLNVEGHPEKILDFFGNEQRRTGDTGGDADQNEYASSDHGADPQKGGIEGRYLTGESNFRIELFHKSSLLLAGILDITFKDALRSGGDKLIPATCHQAKSMNPVKGNSPFSDKYGLTAVTLENGVVKPTW